MANGSCHLRPLQNPSKRSHGTLGSSEDACVHSLKIMMICLTIIMAPRMKLYLKRTRQLCKKFMRICNQSVNMSGRWICWTSWIQKRCGQRQGIKRESMLLQLKVDEEAQLPVDSRSKGSICGWSRKGGHCCLPAACLSSCM